MKAVNRGFFAMGVYHAKTEANIEWGSTGG